MGSSRPSRRPALAAAAGLVLAVVAAGACSPFVPDAGAGADGGARDGQAPPDEAGAPRDAGTQDGDGGGGAPACFTGASLCETFEGLATPAELRDRGWVTQDGLTLVGACDEGQRCLRSQVPDAADEARLVRPLVLAAGPGETTVELSVRVVRGTSLDVVEVRNPAGTGGVFVGLEEGAWSAAYYLDSTVRRVDVAGAAADGWHRVRLVLRTPAAVTVAFDGNGVTLPQPPAGLDFTGSSTLRVGTFSTNDRDAVDVDRVGVAP